MSRRSLLVVLGTLAIAGAACSAGSGEEGSRASSPPSPTEGGEATELRLAGSALRFDVETLTVAADVGFTIVFDNRDSGIPHNIAVYRSGPPAKDQVAKTDLEPGPTTQRLSVPALAPGRYFYQCDIHPTTMTGSLMVTSRR